MTPKERKRLAIDRKYHLIELSIAGLSVILLLIGYTGNGIRIQHSISTNETTYIGLWNAEKCTAAGKCEMISMKDLLEKDDIPIYFGYTYEYAVGNQTTLTIAFICGLITLILYLLKLFGQISGHRMRLGSIISSLTAGVFLARFCGLERMFQSYFNYVTEKENLLFPWSLSCLGISTYCLVGIYAVCFIQEFRMRNGNIESIFITSCKQFPVLFFTEAGLSMISILFQISGFFSDGWFITEDVYRTHKETYKSLFKIGIWYHSNTNCEYTEDLAKCKTFYGPLNRAYVRNYRENSVPDLIKAHCHGYDVLITISVVSAIVVGILFLVALCRRISIIRMRLFVMVCALISGISVVHLSCESARFQHQWMIDQQYDTTHPDETLLFPYGLFLSGLGGVIILAVSVMSFLTLYPDNKNPLCI